MSIDTANLSAFAENQQNPSGISHCYNLFCSLVMEVTPTGDAFRKFFDMPLSLQSTGKMQSTVPLAPSRYQFIHFQEQQRFIRAFNLTSSFIGNLHIFYLT